MVPAFLNALRKGLVISGGQDKLIYAHAPGDKDASHVLVGHEANVFGSKTTNIRFAL